MINLLTRHASRGAWSCVIVLLLTSAAFAQQHVSICTLRTNTVNGVSTQTCQPVSANNPLPTLATGSAFPVNPATGAAATPKNGVGSGTTGAVSASLSATSNLTNYLCSFSVSAAGTGSDAPITVTGLLGGTLTYQQAAVGTPLIRSFAPCIPASAVNTAITVTTTADATATAVNVDVQGYGL